MTAFLFVVRCVTHPNTSTIQWSHNMRTHILNRIVHAGYTPHTQDTADSSEVEIIPNPTHTPATHTHSNTAHAQQHSHSTKPKTKPQHMVPIGHVPRDTRSAGTSSTHTQHTHTHSTQGTQGASQHLRHPGDAASTADTKRNLKSQVSNQNTAHTHILARDCLTTTTTAYWEGDRNDQCEVCDKGGTLTECTRCNIVWHASCLHPIPPFPIRTQDAIVCGQACWLELTEALRQEGRPHPTAELKTTRQFLPRSHNTTNTTHSFPLVTYPTAKTTVQQKTSVECAGGSPDPQATPEKHCITSPTKKRTRNFDPPERPRREATSYSGTQHNATIPTAIT